MELVRIIVAIVLALIGAAGGGAPADRGADFDPAARCDLATVTAIAAEHPDVEQLVVASTESFAATSGSVFVAVRSGGAWRCQTAPVDARFGRHGTRPLTERRSGDGTTPAGVFPLGEVTAWDGQAFSIFGNRPDPGARAPYRAVRPQDCWGATPGSPSYQRLIEQPECPGPDDEWLPRYGDVYAHAAVIGANLDPVSGDAPGEPPYAAAIFLHRHSYVDRAAGAGPTKATSGCISVAIEPLVEIVRLLDPTLGTHFAIGPVDRLRGTH